MFRVLVADSIANEGVETLKKYNNIHVEVKTGLKPEELEEIIGEYDGLIVRSATQFKGKVVEKATKMKVVGRAGAGVDNIDVPLSTKKGIVVMNTPGGNSQAAAELTIAMITALSRNIVPATISMKNGKWEKGKFEKTSVEVAGKTLGIIGAGNIGSIVAARAIGLNMKVIVYDPFLTDEKAAILGVKKVSTLDDIYKDSDYITLHISKNEQTVNLINKDSIAKMKDGVYIINCARGGIVNENDLLEALESGKVKGAGLDVFEKEPVDPDNPLVKHPNVICTPHLGASTVEAQVNVAVEIARQIGDYLTKNEIRNAVNIPNIDSNTMSVMRPYINLAKKIGDLYRQFANINIHKIEIDYAGEVYNLPINPITHSLLIGLLSDIAEGINFVNAPIVAKDRGIEIIETNNSVSKDYASQITLTTYHKEGKTIIKGAVFKEGLIRIVGIDNFSVDFIPEGNLLLTINEDKPGFIGSIGTILGNAGLNIANMELGRDILKKEALSFIQIDGDIPDSLIEEMKKNIPTLKKVFKIKMD
ncbi:MAG TPA: phosphoglycerate dehydrogenase [Spirochaetota bacterium]|nr:phosphoglycerate dehydrogenase [Spirochaetota bacterium]HOL56978.1 phosphoglycerate dehydrogenase [Spirochaetota bacterium]HPP04561.1 phosphoglycerate dehydrogenase [Spirochaetota bacterium]